MIFRHLHAQRSVYKTGTISCVSSEYNKHDNRRFCEMNEYVNKILENIQTNVHVLKTTVVLKKDKEIWMKRK